MSPIHSSPLRRIRSFVRREGRLTQGQQRALKEIWPRFGIDPQSTLDLHKHFGRVAPLTLEIGFGNGATLLEMAQQHAERDYIGIEVHRPGVGHLLLELERLQLSNVRVIREDAVEIVRKYIPHNSLHQILILFPDPWPKKRHHKRRLIQSALMELLADKLVAGGTVRLATDWQAYGEHMLNVLEGIGTLHNKAGTGKFAARPAELTATKFERRGDSLGHGVWYLYFQRT